MTKEQIKSKQQYERFKPVTIPTATKRKLLAVCAALSTEYATVTQVSMLDKLITDKYNSLIESGDIQK